MTTRAELLGAYEAGLNGFIIRADAFKHPYTDEWRSRYPVGPQGQPPAAKVLPDLKSAIIEIEEDPGGISTLERHVAFYWDNDQEVKGNVQFYVMNRGQPDESACWLKGQDPKPPVPPLTFQQTMVAWLNSQMDQSFGEDILRHIESVTANNELGRGTASVIMETASGDFVRKSVAIWKDASEVWQFKPIT